MTVCWIANVTVNLWFVGARNEWTQQSKKKSANAKREREAKDQKYNKKKEQVESSK